MSRSSRSSAVARNVASAYGLRALLALSALALTPYLYRRLGSAGFGTWSVMFTVTTVFSLLELGISAGVAKYVAEFKAAGRPRELEATLAAALVLMTLMGVLALAISLLIGRLAPQLAAAGQREAFQTGMVVLGLAMLARFPLVAYAATLTGYQRWSRFNAAQAAATAAFALGAVVAIEAGGGILGLAIDWAAAYVAGGVLFAVLLARAEPSLSLRPRRPSGASLRRIGTFSSFTLLADSMGFIAQRMDTVVIAAIRNAAAAAPFAAAVKLQSGLQSLTLPFIDLLMPMMSELSVRQLGGEVVRRFTLATRIALQLTLPAAVAIALFAPDIVRLWLGRDAGADAASIVVVLVAVQTVTLAAAPAEKVLVGIGRVRLVGALALVDGLSNLAASIALVAAYGAIGAALGTLATSALVAPVKIPLACRATGASLAAFAREGLGRAITSSILPVAVMVAIRLLLPPGAVRAGAGLGAGLALAAAIGLAQVGSLRLRALFTAARERSERLATPVDPSSPLVQSP